MRAVIKNNIGIFTPQGFLDGNNTQAFFTLDDIKATEHLKVEMLLVSLKKVIFFNKNGIDTFVQFLLKMRLKNHIIVGFCDYNDKKYIAINSFYQDKLTFSLFKTFEIASLFCSSFNAQGKTVLLYHKDPSQRSAMAIELFERGHNPIISQTKDDFRQKQQNAAKYDFIIEDTYLNILGQRIATKVKGNAIIYTISGFLDAEIIENFDITYHNSSLHVGFRLFIFDAYKVISINIHALRFFTKLSTSAAEYDAVICFAGMSFEKTPVKFQEELEDSGILFFDSIDMALKENQEVAKLSKGTTSTSAKKSLSRVVVQRLPEFINAVITTVEMMTNIKAVKKTVNIQPITIDKHEGELLSSSIGFYGAIDGILVLVFPISLAKRSCELLIGENTDNLEDILDALAEFVNIIGGRIKTLLRDYDLDIDITLPRTYANTTNLQSAVENKKGVQANLSFDNSDFIFFLTR